MKHSFRVSDSEISDGASLLETVEPITGKIQVCYKRFPLRVIPWKRLRIRYGTRFLEGIIQRILGK